MKITETVFQLETTKRSHSYLVHTDKFFLIDTGIPGLADKILAEIQCFGVSSSDIHAILLTHHDVDHIGNASQLQKVTGAELWAPAEDVPFIDGKKNRPGVKHLIETIVRPQKPVITGTYNENWPYSTTIHVLPAPGHTPGHTIFKIQNVIFTGDLFKFVNGHLRSFPMTMNWNQDELQRSLSTLRNLEFEWLCPSHGDPIRNGPQLQSFLTKFN